MSLVHLYNIIYAVITKESGFGFYAVSEVVMKTRKQINHTSVCYCQYFFPTCIVLWNKLPADLALKIKDKDNRLDSSVGRESVFAAGGREFESGGRIIPNV